MKANGLCVAIGVMLIGISWRLAQHSVFDGHGVVASFPDLWLVAATIVAFVGGTIALVLGTIFSLTWLNDNYDS